MRLIPVALLSLAVSAPACAQYMDPALEMHALTHEYGPFQYDGAYWHYYQHNWYVSQMYGGPWTWVEPVYVPVYVQQVPVRHGRRPQGPQVDPQLARKMQSNPQLPSDAAVRQYFWGGGASAQQPVQTGIERPGRR